MTTTHHRTRWTAIFIIVALAAVVAVVGLRSRPVSRAPLGSDVVEVAGRSPLPSSQAHPTASAGPSNLSTSTRSTAETSPAIAVRPVAGEPRGEHATSNAVYASRLSNRPGYYAPSDPESMSVITGKRDAPPVDLELDGGAASLEDLGREILMALGNQSLDALNALRVTKHEFRVICWPEFPESRPVTNIQLDDAWMMAATQSHAGSERAVGLYGGRNLELVDVETAAPFAYRNFTRHGQTVFIARDVRNGEIIRLTFAPSVIERHGRYKVLGYRDR